MSTRLLYFAWVKEKTGIAAEDVELPREVTIVEADEPPPPPPLPPPARLLGSSAEWVDEVDVHRLMSLQ